MKTCKLFLLPVLESLEFGSQVIRYALIFVSRLVSIPVVGGLHHRYTRVAA